MGTHPGSDSSPISEGKASSKYCILLSSFCKYFPWYPAKHFYLYWFFYPKKLPDTLMAWVRQMTSQAKTTYCLSQRTPIKNASVASLHSSWILLINFLSAWTIFPHPGRGWHSHGAQTNNAEKAGRRRQGGLVSPSLQVTRCGRDGLASQHLTFRKELSRAGRCSYPGAI